VGIWPWAVKDWESLPVLPAVTRIRGGN